VLASSPRYSPGQLIGNSGAGPVGQQLEQGLVKVSVVVPVYNPGSFIEPGIASILAQTMPPDQLEAVFIDDGSTDETPDRLDALAAAHSNVRVIHTPNSGWAGRPRNIGIREARGEYIQFMDQDDSLAPDALERLYEMAVRNRSDIVIGKVASNFRPVPQHLFRRNIDACTLRDAPLISSLTPHKMFRTAFLREHRIEFPEGRRRLEDQLFMVRAYLAAGTVSVLADRVCYIYARRADGGNAAASNPDPAMYFGNLREILDVIVANTEPGPLRTELLGRFYRTGMIDRLSEPFYLVRPESVQQALYREIRALAVDFADDEVQARLGSVRQIRSDLLRADRPRALLELARRLRRLRAIARLREERWTGRRLRVELDARLEFQPDGRPFRLLSKDGDVQVDPWILEGILDAPFPVHEPSPWVRLECFLHERVTGAEWRVPTSVTVDVGRVRAPDGGDLLEPTIRAVATVDVDRIAGGHAVEVGTWELQARVFGPGIDRRARVTPIGIAPPPAVLVPQVAGLAYIASASETRGVAIRALAFARSEAADGHGLRPLPTDASRSAPREGATVAIRDEPGPGWIKVPVHDNGLTSRDLPVGCAGGARGGGPAPGGPPPTARSSPGTQRRHKRAGRGARPAARHAGDMASGRRQRRLGARRAHAGNDRGQPAGPHR
jgi:glycosyltransferase involved in cell wall biosynthesis